MPNPDWREGFIAGLISLLAFEAVLAVLALIWLREWLVNCLGPNGCS